MMRRLLPRTAVNEVLAVWAYCFGATAVAYAFSPTAAKIVATLGFLYLPLWAAKERGEDFAEYGLHLGRWREDVKLFLGVMAVLTPLFIVGFWGFAHVLEALPSEVAQLVAPYTTKPHFQFRLPPRFDEWVIDHFLVVAVPEEFFYRGYMQTRLRDAWPEGRMFFGGRLGRAFWLTAALFALGHLAIFKVWRLGVFFPALLFGWMRERTGTVVGAALCHGAANLMMMVMEASFYG